MKVPYTKSGKRGDLIFQRNRWGVQISYPYHVPANPRSSGQRFVRANFAARVETIPANPQHTCADKCQHHAVRRKVIFSEANTFAKNQTQNQRRISR
mgnify:CR=1 FL=1